MNDASNERVLLGYSIDLDELAQTLRHRWRLVLASVACAVVLAIGYLHLADYTYTATLTVSPVLSSSSENLSSKLGNLGGLASLAGINIGSDFGSQAFMLYQNGLYSRDVANDLSKRSDILQKIFYEQWDADGRQWMQPSPLVSTVLAFIKRALGIPVRAWQPPDGALLQEYIADNVKLDSDPQKPIVTITFRHQDPQFAVDFLYALDRTADEKLRQNALVRANLYVSYLSDRLKSVTNTDVREALVATLANQEKTLMMASATAPYAAQPFGLPSASRKPTNPNPTLVMTASVFVGLLFGVLAAIWLPPLHWPTRFRKHFGTPSSDTGR